MQFSIPTNWQDDLLPKINKTGVVELYGKLESDFIGGGKHSFQLPDVSKKQIEKYIRNIHKFGLEFNYLLNATCLNNLESTIFGQKQICRLLDWLVKIKVDAVTVSIPYLLELIKRQYPALKVYISTLANIDTIQKAKLWEELGADRITLLNTDLNRNFYKLRQIRKNIKCKIQLIANANCLYGCPFHLYHANSASHSSQSLHSTRGFIIDYCRISCRYMQLANPVEFIRSTWIRPEDSCYYQNIGIDILKIIDRGMSSEALSLIVNAYVNKTYNGNLMDLFPHPLKTLSFKKFNPVKKFKYFFRPFTVNVFRLLKSKDLLSEPPIYIDNNLLDGFIDHFLKNDCSAISCKECGYCESIAKKVVKINKDLQNEIVVKYCKYLNSIISGTIFKYLN